MSTMRAGPMEQTDGTSATDGAEDTAGAGNDRAISPAAQRALREAQARRREAEAEEEKNPLPREIGGRGGKDPSRYGDWEIKGRAIDF